MKKLFLSLIVAATVFFCIFTIEGYAEENVCFPEYKTKVIEVDITISDENFSKIKQNPEAKETYEAGVTIDGKTFKKIGIRTRGSSSLKRAISLGKNRYPFELKLDEFENGANFNSANSIKLNNCIGDRVIAEYMAYEMCRDMGITAPDCSLAFVKINGKDWGIYLAVEAVNKNFIKRHSDGKLSGSLYKSVSDVEGEKNIFSTWFKSLETKYTTDNNEFLLSLQDSLDKNNYSDKINIDELLKYYAISMACGDSDSLLTSTRNFYIYINNGKADFIPWDLDFAFEDFESDMNIDGFNDERNNDSNPLFNLVLKNEEYKEKYHKLLLEVTEKYLNHEYVGNTVSDLTKLLKPYYKRDRTAPDGTYEYWLAYNEWCENETVQLTIPTKASVRYEQIKKMLDGTLDSFYVPDEIVKIKEQNIKNEETENILKIVVASVFAVVIISAAVIIIMKKRKKK